MSTFAYIVADAADAAGVTPFVLGVVENKPFDLAAKIYDDIMSEFTNITAGYTVSTVGFGNAHVPIEYFEESGLAALEYFLTDNLEAITYSFFVNFYDCGDIIEDIQLRYTIQDQ